MTLLPGTSLELGEIYLGGNRLGGDLDQSASYALLDAFAQAGGCFIDTAHVYADWLPQVERSCSEKMLGRWCKDRRPEGIVIATKIGHPRLHGNPAARLDRTSLRKDVAEALDNLGTDCLPLVYLHRDDPGTPAEAILGVLEELVADGLIRCYAASNWTAARLAEAQEAARRSGWPGFRANQAEWSLAKRNPGTAAGDLQAMEAGMVAWHRRAGVLAVPYSSQARGYFDKIREDSLDDVAARNYDSPTNRARGASLARLADRHGVTPTEAMLALFRLAPFPVVPVVGCRTPDHVASSFRGLGVRLDPDEAAPLLAGLGLQMGRGAVNDAYIQAAAAPATRPGHPASTRGDRRA